MFPPESRRFFFFFACLLAYYLGRLQDVHVYVRIGNALAFIQLLRHFRKLDLHEKTVSVFVSFTHVAIASQVVLGPSFILILLSFIYLLPASLMEIAGAGKRKPRDIFRDYAGIAAVSCLFSCFSPG